MTATVHVLHPQTSGADGTEGAGASLHEAPALRLVHRAIARADERAGWGTPPPRPALVRHMNPSRLLRGWVRGPLTATAWITLGAAIGATLAVATLPTLHAWLGR